MATTTTTSRTTIRDQRAAARAEAKRVLADRRERQAARQATRGMLRTDWTLEVRTGAGTLALFGTAEDGTRVMMRIAAADLSRLAGALRDSDLPI